MAKRSPHLDRAVLWISIAAAGAALGACAANRPRSAPPAMLPGVEESMAPDDLPPTNTSGLGTPGGDEDAGLPAVPLDGGVNHGGWNMP